MGKSSFTPYQILNHLTFFKLLGLKLPQIGKTGYQTTPLHLYIQTEVKFLVVFWSGGGAEGIYGWDVYTQLV